MLQRFTAALLIAAVCAFAVALGVLIVRAVNEPSCSDRGGRRVFSHVSPVMVGKTIVMLPQYRCEGART